MSKRIRSSNFSQDELSTLSDLVAVNSEALYGSFSTKITSSQKSKLWEDITNAVNAVGGSNRTTDQVMKKVTKVRSEAKTKDVENRRSAIQTGGGASTFTPLADYEEKLLATVPAVSITGIFGGIDSSNEESIRVAVEKSSERNVEIEEASHILGLVTDGDVIVSNLTENCQNAAEQSTGRLESNLRLHEGRCGSFSDNINIGSTPTTSKKRKAPEPPRMETLLAEQVDLLKQQIGCFDRIEGLMAERINTEKRKADILDDILHLLRRVVDKL